MTNANHIQHGRAALRREGSAITALADQLDESFDEAVQMLLDCSGHVIASGGGTSGIVARRLAHLLSCVGAPALYLDAGQASHGSAGALTANDVLIAISKGGETDELNAVCRVAQKVGTKIIALTSFADSTMASLSDLLLVFETPADVDGHSVITFGNSLAASALGDALCFAILEVRGYDAEHFADLHPSGRVGRILRGDEEG